MFRPLVSIAAILACASTTLAQSQANCSLTQKCPKETPCCSQYGQCGVGAYCLGGCDPRMSFGLDSCVPAPQCESKSYAMDSMDGIVDVSKYLGDPKKADWVSQGQPLVYKNNLLLTMPAKSVGTVLATTTYLWYGTVTAKLKTSRGAGVVTAFILLSDVKDEIDYEFVGTELESAQTNYYFQAIPNYDNSGNVSLSDTYNNFHTYQIQWTPDTITWLVDGKVGRVKKRSETWNSTTNQWDYPQTPARVQISIWPGGASSNAPGTIEWAGGPIDWDSEDIKNHGYYYTTFGQIDVECFNATSDLGSHDKVSYTYNDRSGTNNTVVIGDKPTVLKSFLGTGTDMDAAEESSSAKPSSSKTGSATSSATKAVNTVPGGSAQGPGSGGSDQGSGSGGSGDSGSTDTASAPTCTTTGFTQDCDSGSSSSSSSGTPSSDGGRAVGGERILGASAFAVVIALAGMVIM